MVPSPSNLSLFRIVFSLVMGRTGAAAQRPASAPKTSDGACALFSPELLDLNAPCDDSPAEGLHCHESLEIEAFDFRESATDPNAARRPIDPVAPATATISDQAGEVERYTDAIEIDSFLFLESSTRADVVAGGLPWPFDRSSGDGGRGERAAAVEWGEEAQPVPLSLPQPVAKKASSPIRPAAKTIKKRKANAPAGPPLRSGSDGDQEPQKKRRTRSPFKPAVDTTACTGSPSTVTATATATTTAAAMATRRESQQSPTKPQRRRVAADPATCDEYDKLVEIYRAFGSRARDKLASIDDQQRTYPTYTGSLSVTARQMLIDALGELSSLLQTAVGDTQPAPAVAAASATERRMSVGGIRRRIRALKPVVERLCDAMTWRPPTADTKTPTVVVATATPTTTATTMTPPASPPSSDSGLSSARTSASTSPSSPPPSFNETVASGVPPSPSPSSSRSTQRVDTPQLARDLGVLPSFICRPVRLIYDDADDGEEEGNGPC